MPPAPSARAKEKVSSTSFSLRVVTVEAESFGERVRGVAALDHPVTQAVYRLLVERGRLSRDETAESLEIARSVAAFHLDKLVEVGLAEADFERLTGRSGPGAGRPAKMYRRSDREIELSLPQRHYDLAGGVLAEALERATREGLAVQRAVRDAAVETGRALGEADCGAAGAGASRVKRRSALLRVLERHGYEPQLREREIVLRNCPFHVLAEQHRGLVCRMNLELLSGIIEGAGGGDLISACLAPEPGSCCVRMTSR
ncbi:MAG: helix-turn-helix domain-containing protein [Actinobacteria bacterium]|nr:helix-turn-helix domain-containing protein [Actinomycetota bacterium]